MSMRARFGGCSKSVFAAVLSIPEVAIGQDRGEAIQVLQPLFIVNVQASTPWQEPRGVQRWETAEAEHGQTLLCPGTRAGAHSGVRLAVVPLSGEIGRRFAPSLETYAKRSKIVRLQTNPIDGVNRAAVLRRARESFGQKGCLAGEPNDSPGFSTTAGTALARL
jgi:hypothetical protein